MTHHYGKLPAGVKKHIRLEKARIRREYSDTQERAEVIHKLYNKFSYYLEDTSKEKAPETAKSKARPKPKKKPAKPAK